MRNVTFQIVEGVDKGRLYTDLPLPVSIGREEGNLLRLNDERVSRFHAKLQFDGDDFILTDLDSTNGTRINGHPVQIRRLLPGDRVGVGRSILVFGSAEEIRARVLNQQAAAARVAGPHPATVAAASVKPEDSSDMPDGDRFWIDLETARPPLPLKLTPSQAARLSEILDFMHRGLASALDPLQANDDGTKVTIPFSEFQKIQAVQMLLANYLRLVAEPDGGAV